MLVSFGFPNHNGSKRWCAGDSQLTARGEKKMSHGNTVASSRQFHKWMSASTLLAKPGLAAWAGEGVSPTTRLPDPVMWGSLTPQEIITSPKEAINVFDFELAARRNVPPAHFGYMASGID